MPFTMTNVDEILKPKDPLVPDETNDKQPKAERPQEQEPRQQQPARKSGKLFQWLHCPETPFTD